MIQQTEFYSLDHNSWIIGPPLRVAGHCMLKLAEDQVIVTGGFQDSRIPVARTLLFQFSNPEDPSKGLVNEKSTGLFRYANNVLLNQGNIQAIQAQNES